MTAIAESTETMSGERFYACLLENTIIEDLLSPLFDVVLGTGSWSVGIGTITVFGETHL